MPRRMGRRNKRAKRDQAAASGAPAPARKSRPGWPRAGASSRSGGAAAAVGTGPRGALDVAPAGRKEREALVGRLTSFVAASAPEIGNVAGVVATKLAKPYQVDNAPPAAKQPEAVAAAAASRRGPRRGRRFALARAARFAEEREDLVDAVSGRGSGWAGPAAAVSPAGRLPAGAPPRAPEALPSPGAASSSTTGVGKSGGEKREPVSSSTSATAAAASAAAGGGRSAGSAASRPGASQRISWRDALEMHSRWRDFAAKYLATTAHGCGDLLTSATEALDLTFAYAAVTRCARCPELAGAAVIVVNETRSTFQCVTPTSRRVVLPKQGTWLAVPLPRSRRLHGADAAKGPVAVEENVAVLECNGSCMLQRGGSPAWQVRS